ncbi:hypothetical protein KJ693_12595 [bacterium]|nr:hypothetical protein [bacterium]
MTKVQQIISIISGLIFIIGAPSTYFGLPLPSLLLFNKHTISRISTNPQFSIEAIKTSRKVTINSGDHFSYKFETPLTARGTTSLPDNETVWVIVADQTGRFYLQHPPVKISSGRWDVTNILPLERIKRIIFARVDVEGNRFFLRKVEHDEWGKFNTMPSGATEIAFVQIE